MSFTFTLEHEDGSPAEPSRFSTAVPNWSPGDTIPLGNNRTLRVVEVRPGTCLPKPGGRDERGKGNDLSALAGVDHRRWLDLHDSVEYGCEREQSVQGRRPGRDPLQADQQRQHPGQNQQEALAAQRHPSSEGAFEAPSLCPRALQSQPPERSPSGEAAETNRLCSARV